jgi:hypothetical protein
MRKPAASLFRPSPVAPSSRTEFVTDVDDAAEATLRGVSR